MVSGRIFLGFAWCVLLAAGGCNGAGNTPGDGAAATVDAAAPDLKRSSPPDSGEPGWPVGPALSFTALELPPEVRGPVGHCLAFTDLDADGWPDLFLTPSFDVKVPITNAWFLHNNAGTGFTAHSVPTHTMQGPMDECTVGDLDNDGLPDIFLEARNGSALLHNQGQGNFTDVTIRAGLGAADTGARSCALLDYDNDGFLDVLIAPQDKVGGVLLYPVMCVTTPDKVACGVPGSGQMQPEARLYRSFAGQTFAWDKHANLTNEPNFGNPLAVGIVDLDFDGYADAIFANDFAQNRYYRNTHDRHFVDLTDSVGFPLVNNAMGVAAGDYDGDGRLDLAIAEVANAQLWMGQPDGTGLLMAEHGNQVGVGRPQRTHVDWAPVAGDFNRDGWLDFFMPSSAVVDNTDDFTVLLNVGMVMANAAQEDTFFVNQGAALAFETQRVLQDKPHRITFDGASAAVADLDRDGALDVAELYGANPSFQLRVLHNQTAGGHHLAVKLVGGPTVNREAYGATVRLTVGGRVLLRQLQATTGSLGKSSAVLHFGLGDHTAADHLSIVWPGGATQEVDGPFAADQELTVTQK